MENMNNQEFIDMDENGEIKTKEGFFAKIKRVRKKAVRWALNITAGAALLAGGIEIGKRKGLKRERSDIEIEEFPGGYTVKEIANEDVGD